MTGINFLGPNELRAGAMPSPAAASAVRPPGFRQHRGMRSFDAKSRRLFAWKARVSRVNTSSSDVNVNPLNGDADVVALVWAPGACGVIPASAVVPIPTSHLVLSDPLSFDTVVEMVGPTQFLFAFS